MSILIIVLFYYIGQYKPFIPFMKSKLLISLLLSVASINQLSAQELPSKTTWEGNLNDIRLILKISKDSVTKQNTAVFDSPNQGALGLKVSELKITKDSLSAFSAQIGGGFSGAFNANKTEISGVWQQGGTLPLMLKRVDMEAEINRPQMPKAPFPYLEEKVVYFNQDKSIQYGATLTLPDTNTQVPVVILITGSGQQDRDETLFGHKPFFG